MLNVNCDIDPISGAYRRRNAFKRHDEAILRHCSLYIQGVISFTHRGSQLPRKAVQRFAKSQQVHRTKGGSARCHSPELIHRIDISERACDRAKPPIFAGVDHPVLAPMTTPAHQLEGAAAQGMEGMRDPYLEAGRTHTPRS
jgi:hypothetical protein